MNGKALTIAAAILLGIMASCSQALAAVQLPNTYDFSQTANNTWINYCAPTAAGDLIYHFGNSYPSLLQGNSYGPGGDADTGAVTIIGGVAGFPDNNSGDPPGPPAASLAGLMNTTRSGGTTLDQMNTGVTSYLTAHSSTNTVTWTTAEVFVANFAGGNNHNGQNFFNFLKTNIDNGADVLLAVHWQGGVAPGGSGYQLPDNYDYTRVSGDAPSGHIFEMVGYDLAAPSILVDDPANNWGANNWAPVADSYGLNGANWPNKMEFTVNGVTGTVYGAVVVQGVAVPEPSGLLLLAAGAASLGICAARRWRQ